MSTAIAAIPGSARSVLEGLLGRLSGHAHELEGLRAAPRHAVHAPVQLGVVPQAQRQFRPLCRAWAVDLSRQGLGLLMEQELPAELSLWANLAPLAGQACLLPLRVVYCRQLLSRTFSVGAVFVE